MYISVEMLASWLSRVRARRAQHIYFMATSLLACTHTTTRTHTHTPNSLATKWTLYKREAKSLTLYFSPTRLRFSFLHSIKYRGPAYSHALSLSIYLHWWRTVHLKRSILHNSGHSHNYSFWLFLVDPDCSKNNQDRSWKYRKNWGKSRNVQNPSSGTIRIH